MAHHVKNGWHFERRGDGSVHVRRTAGEWFAPVVTHETFTAAEWDELVAALGGADAEPQTFAEGVAFDAARAAQDEELEGPPAPDPPPDDGTDDDET